MRELTRQGIPPDQIRRIAASEDLPAKSGQGERPNVSRQLTEVGPSSVETRAYPSHLELKYVSL